MTIWALADLHLSLGTPDKGMERFGPQWVDHHKKMAAAWDDCVAPHDLVLIPGDISWAMRLDGAMPDLQWIEQRPGTKLMIRGNHDYWWPSITKLRKALPPSIHALSNDAWMWNGVAFCGARLWDTPDYGFGKYIVYREEMPPRTPERIASDEEHFAHEIERLKMSLKALDRTAAVKIALTHYPPIGPDLADSTASRLFDEAGIQHVVFGHLHNIREGTTLFGAHNGTTYHLTSCDYLNFKPLKVTVCASAN